MGKSSLSKSPVMETVVKGGQAQKRKRKQIDTDSTSSSSSDEEKSSKVKSKKKDPCSSAKKCQSELVNQQNNEDNDNAVKSDTVDEDCVLKRKKRNHMKRMLKRRNAAERKAETLSEKNQSDIQGDNPILGPDNTDEKQSESEIDEEDQAKFTSVGDQKLSVKKLTILHPKLRDYLLANGIKRLLPVQSSVVPWLIKSRKRETNIRDLCVSYPTGSGKTLAFVLPVVQSLINRFVPRIRALVVLPVQELALQVYKVFKKYTEGTPIKVVLTMSSNMSLKEERECILHKSELGGYETLADIIVTTPGRLVEHINSTEGFSLAFLNYLILDEADRLLNSSQNYWLYHFKKHITEERAKYSPDGLPHLQKCLFSATLTRDPEKLNQLDLSNPIFFIYGDNQKKLLAIPREIDERYMVVEEKNKPSVLGSLLKKGWDRCLCFTKSNESASRLALLLKALIKEVKIEEYTQLKTHSERDVLLNEFKEGKISLLITSDRMARGIDIPNVQNVILYDSPKSVETYVHRVGRTGRAGEHGRSLTLVTEEQCRLFVNLASTVSAKLEQMSLDEDLSSILSEYKRAKMEYNKTLKELSAKQIQNVKEAKQGKTAFKAKRFKMKGRKSKKKDLSTTQLY